MFTAWDVTMEVRKRSKDRVQHFEVKKEVHKVFDQGCMSGYNRTLATLQNVTPQPWVYHPITVDPSGYDGKPTAPAVVVALPVSSISSVDDNDNSISDIAADGSAVYKFDTTDRLCVPNKLIREIGLKMGDEIEITCAAPNSAFFVQPKGTGPAAPSVVANYVVDRYDNVRISRATLSKLGISGVAFEIFREGATNSIKVKKYA
jgi:hypothetical protein